MLNHPKFEEARRLLNDPPTFPHYDDDETRMRAGMQSLRLMAGEAAERLIELLDELDGDPDLEPSLGFTVPGFLEDGEREEGDSEPPLGWMATMKQDGPNWWGDWEGREVDDSDREPSLGAAENHPSSHVHLDFWGQRSAFGFSDYTDQGSQADWASGNRDEREGDEHDGAEPDESGIADEDGYAEQLRGEPNLGWTGDANQTRAMRPSLIPWSVEDGEAGDDNGIGDLRGVNFDDEPGDNGIADAGGAYDAGFLYYGQSYWPAT